MNCSLKEIAKTVEYINDNSYWEDIRTNVKIVLIYKDKSYCLGNLESDYYLRVIISDGNSTARDYVYTFTCETDSEIIGISNIVNKQVLIKRASTAPSVDDIMLEVALKIYRIKSSFFD